MLHQFDTAYSIPDIASKTMPGRFTFLDQMVLGVKPGGHAIEGPGLSLEEARSHMSLWVMASSPLLTCNDVRSMSDDIKQILTNEEVLSVHKDPAARMAVRIDVGGGDQEAHASRMCASNWSIYGKVLSDGSSAVMVLNRGTTNASVTLEMEDVGDSMHSTYAVRDLWARANLSSAPVVARTPITVPPHGVRMLRMWPLPPAPPPPPPPPAPRPSCPHGFAAHAPGFWHNTDPCPQGHFGNCTEDHSNTTVALCATKCVGAADCVAFELYLGADAKACYVFRRAVEPPFTAEPACLTCVRNK